MADHTPLDDMDRIALAKLDENFLVTPDSMAASVSGNMKLSIVRDADGSVDLFLLTLEMPGGELLDVRIRRTSLFEQLNVGGGELQAQ